MEIKNLYLESTGVISVEDAVKMHKECAALKDEYLDEENEDLHYSDYFNLLDEDVYAAGVLGEGLTYTLALSYISDTENIVVSECYSIPSSEIPGFDDYFKYRPELFSDDLYIKWNTLYIESVGTYNQMYELPEEMFEILQSSNVSDYKRPDSIRLSSETTYYPLTQDEIEALIGEDT